jgi:hypothetical protein
MPVESSKGLGQGSAQVFDTSGLANQYAQQEATKAQAKYTAQKDLEKKIAEVTSKGTDLWKEKYFATRDDKVLRDKYKTEVIDWMKGRSHLIADPSTPEAQEYNERLQNMMFDFKMSQESKELAEPFITDIGLHREKYTPEAIQYMTEFMNTPLSVFDPSKMKQVNDFDLLADFDKKNTVFFTEQKNNPTNLGIYDVGDEYYGQGTKTFASEQDRQNHMQNVFASWLSNDKAKEKLYEIYGAQAEKEGREVTEVAWESLYPKTELNITDVSYGRKGGTGSKKTFDMNNIVEDVDVLMGEEGETFFGITPTLFKGNKVRMYQTEPMEASYTISKDAIDANTGKPMSIGGTYKIEYGNLMNYNGKAYFGALIKDAKNKDGQVIHKSVLIPADELKETTINNGYEYDNMKNAVMNKGGGGQKSTGTFKTKTGITYTVK